MRPYLETIETLAKLESACLAKLRLLRELTVNLAISQRVDALGRDPRRIASQSYDPAADKRPQSQVSWATASAERVFNCVKLQPGDGGEVEHLVIPPVYPDRESVNGVFGHLARECSDFAGKAVRRAWMTVASKFGLYGAPVNNHWREHFHVGKGQWTVEDIPSGRVFLADDDIPGYRITFTELKKEALDGNTAAVHCEDGPRDEGRAGGE